MKKREKTLLISIIFIVISLFGIIYSAYNIIKWKSDIEENEEIKEKLNEKINEEKNEKPNENNDNEEKSYNIDFASLKKINRDIVAYVKVNNTNIDYTVVKSKDNSYYLNHNFNKKYNIAGWVFADYRNKFNETDRNIIIYGHNMKDGSMFGSLKNVLKSDWYKNKENYNIVLVTPKGTYNYSVFSIYTIEPEDYYIKTNFKNNTEFKNFINTLKKRSIYNFNIKISSKDKILTLSSCTDTGNKRVVLHAKLTSKN